jgi:hypothetical protein
MLFAGFLKTKIGEDKFEQVQNILKVSSNPLALLDSPAPTNIILDIIGQENQDCLRIFKVIFGGSSSKSTTPVNFDLASRLKATTQSPDITINHHSYQ